MAALKYPPKPWHDGQKHSLINGIDFMYSQSLRKWIPVTPSYVSSSQLDEAFGVSTIQELVQKFEKTEDKFRQVDSDIALGGRIWKTLNRPDNPRSNDIWIEQETGKTFSYVYQSDTWVEINYLG